MDLNHHSRFTVEPCAPNSKTAASKPLADTSRVIQLKTLNIKRADTAVRGGGLPPCPLSDESV
ncbi:MAG: hypothetical protein IJ158_09305 [Treponema sp.]|nr:hypothetical protein [Treponema sp.]